MTRRTVWIVIATALTCLLFASVSTSGSVLSFDESEVQPTAIERSPTDPDAPFGEPTPSPAPTVRDGTPAQIPAWVLLLLAAIALAIVSTYTAVLAMHGWRNRPSLRWRRRGGDGGFDDPPDVAAAVVDEAAAQRAELLVGAPRNAIVRCWLRLEHDVAAVGLTRDPADTSAEFTERILARYTVDSEAIDDLATLYREARFSAHELDEASRLAALDALDRLHRALTERDAEPVEAVAR